jgi:hypothetical protein
MALVHNALIRGFNSIYVQVPYIRDEVKSDFIGYSLTWAKFATSHHHDEEDNLFIKVAELLQDNNIWTETHKEHEAFIDGVKLFETYLTSLPDKKALSPERLISIMDSFREPLGHHLHSEVTTIANLSTHPRAPPQGTLEAAAAADVFKNWGKKTITKAGMADVAPFFFLNLDRTFEQNMWWGWPPMPKAIRWGIVNIAGMYHGNWWKFASCAQDGTPRELFGLEYRNHGTKGATAPKKTSEGEL